MDRQVKVFAGPRQKTSKVLPCISVLINLLPGTKMTLVEVLKLKRTELDLSVLGVSGLRLRWSLIGIFIEMLGPVRAQR